MFALIGTAASRSEAREEFPLKGLMSLSVMKGIFVRGAAVMCAVILFPLILNSSPAQARMQDERGAFERVAGQDAGGPDDRRRSLMQRLNLAREQIERIKAIREENKEEWRATRQRLRQAQRALDDAIYSDSADEAVIEARSQEVASAQTALVRMRAMTELKIRRVLTREQLNTLRSLRQQRAAERRRRLPSEDQQGRPRWRRGEPFRGQRP